RDRMQSKLNRAHAAVRKNIEQLESRLLLAAAGPDSYGYVGDSTTFEDINLVANTPGVERFLDLGKNTFNFYGDVETPYRADDGILTLGESPTLTRLDNNGKDNLRNAPFAPVIAPLWSNWRLTHRVTI